MKRVLIVLLAVLLSATNIHVFAEDELVNLALGRGDSAVSVYYVPAISPLPNIFDGNIRTSSEVRGDEGVDGPEFWFDLGGPCVVSKVILYSATQKSGNTVPFRNDIYFATAPNEWHKYSDLGGTVTYTFIPQGELINGVESAGYICKHEFTMPNVNAMYIKMKDPLKSKYRIVYEIEVFGNYAQSGSSVTTLSSIELDKGELTPDFNPYETEYYVDIEDMDSLPVITEAVPQDSNATVEIIQATDITRKAEVIVTASDGINTKQYNINMGGEQTGSSKLKEITSTKGKVSPSISEDITQYSVGITDTDEMPTIEVSTVSDDAVATIIQQPTDADPKAIIEVTTGDGSETTTYTVDVFRYNVNLSSLVVSAGELSPEFSPSVFDYTVAIEDGTEAPTITATAVDSDTQISINQPSATENRGSVTVYAEDENVFRTYNISLDYMHNIDQAQMAALSAIRNYTATNDTVANDILSVVKAEINNPDITAEWTTEFSITKATTKKSGSVTGAITLTLRDDERIVDVSTTISKLTVNGGGGGGGGFGGGGGGAVVRVPEEDNEKPAQPPETPTEKPKDELTGHWGESEIRPLIEKGIVEGDGKSLNLDGKVTRAEFVTMLIRGLNIELVKFEDSGNDVEATDWFADYIQTAVENGFMQGSGNLLRPNDFITREEAATVMMNVYKSNFEKAEDVTAPEFSDEDSISPWAKESVENAASLGLIKGFDTGEFVPLENLKREQAMVMVYRILLQKA